MVFHWSLSDSKSPQVSMTLLSILAVFNCAAVWMVFPRPPTSKSSRPFNNPLVTAPKAPITIGKIFTFMFHIFFYILSRSRYLSFFSLSFSFILYQPVQQSLQFFKFSCFLLLLIIMASGLLADLRWSVCISNSHRSLCVSFCRTAAGFCVYHLFVWSKLNFLHISKRTTLPTQLSLVLYSFWSNLMQSLIMWLIVSSLSLQNLHLQFCCVLSILVLIRLVLMVLFCAAIKWDSVSLSKFLFLSHVHVFLSETLFISRLKRP